MEKIYFRVLMLMVAGIVSFLTAFSQNTGTTTDYAEVYPINPSPTDSVVVAYVYVSNDGCPDYFLTDSIAGSRVYVFRKNLPALGMMCTQVITKFRTTITLGTFSQETEIYFDGVLLKTISPLCTMDRLGTVSALTSNSSIVKDNSTSDMFEIRDKILPVGTVVKFKGTKIQCFAAPCYNIVDCYRVVETPACNFDKEGIVVSGVDGCSGKLFIEDTRVMTTFPQRYVITPGATDLKAGDRVRFGGYRTTIDSTEIKLCYTVGVATCYEKIDTTGCVIDKKGMVYNCGGQLFILEYSPVSSALQLFYIKNGSAGLKAGDKVAFGGYYAKRAWAASSACQIVGVATCYKLIDPTDSCIMDKVGVVVPGIDGCTGRLFVKETTDGITSIRLYEITNASALQIGDKIKFGSVPVKDSMSVLCPVAGQVTCFTKTGTTVTYSLAGKAMAGTELMKSGVAMLFNKNYRKALASYTITDGSFVFINLPPAEYTVYIIPDIVQYKNYLPTFYLNKVSFRKSDYITLNDNIGYLTIELRTYNAPVGTGKIYGNIFFETTALKDTVMAENGLMKVNAQIAANVAVNIPVLLLNTSGEAVAWALTDAYGNYAFENIALDSYKIVSETGAALAEYQAKLTPANPAVNVDLMLKSVSESTGVPETRDNLLGIYPNPVVDNLTITLIQSQEICIYNALGQLLLQQNLNAGKNILNLSTMNKGLLFAKIGNKTIKLMKE